MQLGDRLGRNRRQLDRLIKTLQRALQIFLGRAPGLFDLGFVFNQRVRDDPDLAQAMIENKHLARDHEHHVGRLQIVARVHGNGRLEKTDHVVTDEADGAGNEVRNPGRGDEAKTSHNFFELGQRIGTGFETIGLSAFGDGDAGAVALKGQEWIESDK